MTDTEKRSLEQRLKFDHGLPVGQSLVEFTHNGASRLALVEISNKGAVYYFPKPRSGEMYSSWTKVRGDHSLVGKGAVKVWPEKDAEFMARFDKTPDAVVPVKAAVVPPATSPTRHGGLYGPFVRFSDLTHVPADED